MTQKLVTVVLLPVFKHQEQKFPLGKAGLVVIRRAIEPGLGTLALPGGFVDGEEDWREAGAREVLEETGIIIRPEAILPYDVKSVKTPRGPLCLIFGKVFGLLDADQFPAFVPNDECSERTVVFNADGVSFSTHIEVMQRFFS